MSQIIYSSGVLSPTSISAIKYGIDRGYLYWVEILNFPKGFDTEWEKKHLILYDRQCEDCMGGSYSDKSYRYVFMRPFMAFASEKEQIAFIQSFDADIKTSNPFGMSF